LQTICLLSDKQCVQVIDYPLTFTHFSEFELRIVTLEHWRMSNIATTG